MPYSELIKNFQKVRDYMRQFYVFGFRSRTEYDAKSARSYDNERRRMESWLGGYMSFRQDAGGKNVFLSVDSRDIPGNPLHKAFKAKSFTDGDITFHFYILDILADGEYMTLREIMDAAGERYLAHFPETEPPDESTVRKKLKEYVSLGILRSEKRGREQVYSLRREELDLSPWREAISYFSEADPMGVIGSYLLDREPEAAHVFTFKHHYILHALDSEILCELLTAMQEKKRVTVTNHSVRRGDEKKWTVCPCRILISTQTGRQYLLCYLSSQKRPAIYRLDNIRVVEIGGAEPRWEEYRAYCDRYRADLWGVSGALEPDTDHLEMRVRIDAGEEYILDRLAREGRNGTVERIDDHTWCFMADVYDAYEMVPWLRTFIGRITDLQCSNDKVTQVFYQDIEDMQKLYGGDDDAVS